MVAKKKAATKPAEKKDTKRKTVTTKAPAARNAKKPAARKAAKKG